MSDFEDPFEEGRAAWYELGLVDGKLVVDVAPRADAFIRGLDLGLPIFKDPPISIRVPAFEASDSRWGFGGVVERVSFCQTAGLVIWLRHRARPRGSCTLECRPVSAFCFRR